MRVPPKTIDLGQEWVPAPLNFKVTLSVHNTLNRRCRQHIPAAIDAEVKLVKIPERATPLFIRWISGLGRRCAWAFTVNSSGITVKEAIDAFAATANSLTTETIAVTNVLRWLSHVTSLER